MILHKAIELSMKYFSKIFNNFYRENIKSYFLTMFKNALKPSNLKRKTNLEHVSMEFQTFQMLRHKIADVSYIFIFKIKNTKDCLF